MKKLTKKQLTWYGIAGLGPNMLNLMVGAYLCDALMTEGFGENIEHWTYLNKTLIVIVVWSIFVTIAKIIDGVIDIPLGAFTDNLKSKWGKRRPSMLGGIIVMLFAYLMFLIVPVNAENSIGNTIWFFAWLCVFYSAYTLTMVTYYATFSEVTDNQADRVYLSNVKSTVDIIYFVLGYAAIPAMIGLANIRILALAVLIMMPSMIIPFVLIKERSTKPEDVAKYKEEHPEEFAGEVVEEKDPGMMDSIKYTFKNKDFIVWMIIYSALQFGLQMFLTGFNVYYSGTVGFSGMKVMLCNVAAFGPVPFTLILYNWLNKKKGFKFSLQYTLIIFSVGMICAVFCRPSVFPNETVRLIAIMASNTICSFAIGTFFSVSYTVPSQIAADEKAKTGVSHPAMYFAIQGLFGAGVTAISTGLVWINIKKIPANPDSFFFAPVEKINGLGLPEAVGGGGAGLLTLLVAISCLVAFGLSFLLPKSLVNVGRIENPEPVKEK